MGKAEKELSFFGHLDELRNRLIKSVLAIFICSCAFYAFIDPVLTAIIKPVGKVVFISPADAFLSRMILTIFCGIFLSLPILLYQAWAFVSLGLTPQEQKHIMFFAPVSFLLFVTGGAFAYFLMIPIALKFLLGFSSGLIVPMIAVDKYISFVGMMILGGGIIFELPLAIVFLTKIGIVTPEFLKQNRKYTVVLILTLSALLTPPDIITQILMSIPLMILYEIGIIVSQLTSSKRKQTIND